MSEVFKLRHTPCYNLRHNLEFALDQIDSRYNGTESQIFGPKDLRANTCRN